jgi:exopolyphosphatase/pppGpp-phosphohydrolase
VDIGSNSVRTMVIEWAAGGPTLIHDRGSMTRIGDAIATDGVLRGEARYRWA